MTHNWQKLNQILLPFGALKPQAASDWCGETPLPNQVAQFYEKVGPWGEVYHENVGNVGLTIGIGGNPIDIPPLAKLADYQVGYRTHGITHERLQDWPDDWLVIAAEGANPYFFDSQKEAVYFMFGGAGKWQPRWLAPNIYGAFGALGTIANAMNAVADEDLFDDNFNMLSPARAQVLLSLADFLGGADKAQAFVDVIEWYT